MTDVPSATSTGRPSMVRWTVSPATGGVPRSRSGAQPVAVSVWSVAVMTGTPSWGAAVEVLGPVPDGAPHGHRGEAAHGAQRPLGHDLAQVVEQLEVALDVAAGDDRGRCVSTPRTAPIRQGVHLPHDSTAQNSKAKRAIRAMSTVSSKTTTPPWPSIASVSAKLLVVHRQVEAVRRQVRAQRTTDLDRPDRPAGARAAAVALDQLAERDARTAARRSRRGRCCPPAGRPGCRGTGRAERGVRLRRRRRGSSAPRERQHVVDDGRLAEQALERRDRRLGPHLAALALEALEHRGLLAADVGACPDAHVEVEVRARCRGCRAPSQPCVYAVSMARRRARDRVRVLGADVDVALARAHGVRRDGHALDEGERDRPPRPSGRRTSRSRPRRRCRRRTSWSDSASSTVFHLMPAGKPAPPRPRSPESVTSATTASAGASARARRSPAQPPCASKLVDEQGVDDADPGEGDAALAGEPLVVGHDPDALALAVEHRRRTSSGVTLA